MPKYGEGDKRAFPYYNDECKKNQQYQLGTKCTFSCNESKTN